MKNHFFISMLAAVALLGGLTACNGKLDKAPRADQVPENAVRITASIYNPFAATRSMPLGTAEGQGKHASPSSHLAQGAHEASASSEDDFDQAADYFMIDESDMYAYLASEE